MTLWGYVIHRFDEITDHIPCAIQDFCTDIAFPYDFLAESVCPYIHLYSPDLLWAATLSVMALAFVGVQIWLKGIE